MSRSLALVAVFGLVTACTDAGTVRTGPQAQSPSGGAALATTAPALPAADPGAMDIIIVETAQPAPTDDIDVGGPMAQFMFR